MIDMKAEGIRRTEAPAQRKLCAVFIYPTERNEKPPNRIFVVHRSNRWQEFVFATVNGKWMALLECRSPWSVRLTLSLGRSDIDIIPRNSDMCKQASTRGIGRQAMMAKLQKGRGRGLGVGPPSSQGMTVFHQCY